VLHWRESFCLGVRQGARPTQCRNWQSSRPERRLEVTDIRSVQPAPEGLTAGLANLAADVTTSNHLDIRLSLVDEPDVPSDRNEALQPGHGALQTQAVDARDGQRHMVALHGGNGWGLASSVPRKGWIDMSTVLLQHAALS